MSELFVSEIKPNFSFFLVRKLIWKQRFLPLILSQMSKDNKCDNLRLFNPRGYISTKTNRLTKEINKWEKTSLPWTFGPICLSKQTYNLIPSHVLDVVCIARETHFPSENGKSTNKIGKVLMDFMYRGCIMPRVKKAKWNFLLNMQNPGCLLNDNGSAPCRWVADSVGCASKACWLTLKRPCVSWLWAF